MASVKMNQGAWQLYSTTVKLNQGAWQGWFDAAVGGPPLGTLSMMGIGR